MGDLHSLEGAYVTTGPGTHKARGSGEVGFQRAGQAHLFVFKELKEGNGVEGTVTRSVSQLFLSQRRNCSVAQEEPDRAIWRLRGGEIVSFTLWCGPGAVQTSCCIFPGLCLLLP